MPAVILKHNDTELAERVRRGDPEDWLELATQFANLQKRYESGAQVCGACFGTIVRGAGTRVSRGTRNAPLRGAGAVQ